MSDVLLWIGAWTGCESIGQGALMKHPWFPRPHQADVCVCTESGLVGTTCTDCRSGVRSL